MPSIAVALRWSRCAGLALAGVSLLLYAVPASAVHPAVARVERVLAAGVEDPARDLQRLLDALAAARTVEEKRELVSAIADLGDVRGKSPNAVKSWLREHSPPLLLAVARDGGDPFLQGDALTALREMGVGRRILEEAAAIAEASPDAFVRSRGEILRNNIAALPPETEEPLRPVDPAAAAEAIALLDELGVTVSTAALRSAARDAQEEVVAALLAAGVPPDTGLPTLTDTPIYHATFLGCQAQGQETDWLVQTVDHLVRAGADLTRVDDNSNTVLVLAARDCGPRVIARLLDGGARLDARNGSGMTPLTMALVMGNFDAAEMLVARGAKLAARDRPTVSGVTDERGRALIRRAGG
jgi:hypothetical protein